MDKFSEQAPAAGADGTILSIAEAVADPYGVFKGAPNVGVVGGPSFSPFYKQALSQSEGVSNSVGSEGPDQPEL